MTSNGQNKTTKSNLLVNCPLVNITMVKVSCYHWIKTKKKKEKKRDNKLAIRLSKTCHTTYNVLIIWLTNNFILKECATHVKFEKWFSIGTVLVWNMINIKERSILEHTVCIFSLFRIKIYQIKWRSFSIVVNRKIIYRAFWRFFFSHVEKMYSERYCVKTVSFVCILELMRSLSYFN